MTHDRVRPPARSSARRRLHGLGALALALGLLVEPGLVAAREQPADGIGPTSVAADLAQTASIAGPGSDSATASLAEPDPAAAGGDEPSIMAIDAAAHANDRIAFSPGARVSLPFTPRPDDGWTVDGLTPQRLPAGAATGRSLLAAGQGSIWSPGSTAPQASQPLAPVGTPRPVDGPAGDVAMPADPASALIVTDRAATAPAATDLRRQVFGFLPYWELGDGSTRLKFDLLSTIAYFGVGADANGNLVKRNRDGSTNVGWAGWASSRMTSVIQAAHVRRTRVVLTVQAFAWTTNQANSQDALLGSAAARLTLARQIAGAVRDRGADGVNLDFEPLVSGRSDEFVALVRTIRSELARIARGYQLTFDTTGSIGNYPLEAAIAPGGADAIFVMGYDYRTADSNSAGSIAPLNGVGYDLVDTILAYTDRVPASRLILGLPYYGRAWSTTTGALDARTQTGAKYGYSASVTYANAVALEARYGKHYDPAEATAWVAYRRRNCTAAYGCVTSWREVYFDDARSLAAKYDTINRFGLRGAGIWALGYDDTRPELYQAIVAKFLHDTTPPDSGIIVLPSRIGDEGFVVRWSAQDMSPIRGYDVQYSVDRGRWHTWLTGTKATEAVLLGQDGHGYAFRARATDAKGNRGAWNIAGLPTSQPVLGRGGFATVRTATLTMRSRPTTAGSAISQLAQGDVVAITGGPVQADGYTWYQVAGPLTTWAPVEPVRTGTWVAGTSASAAYLSPRTPPNTTIVDAGISGLSFGAGGPGSLGSTPAARAARAFSPNGDGSADRLGLRWTNGLALDTLVLRVFRPNGTPVGTRPVPDLAAGIQTWAWDGTVGGSPLPDGSYMLQLVGTAGGHTYSAPSARPISAPQLSLYAVSLDTVAPRLTASSISGGIISPPADGRHDSVALSAASTGGPTGGSPRPRSSAIPLARQSERSADRAAPRGRHGTVGRTPGPSLRTVDTDSAWRSLTTPATRPAGAGSSSSTGPPRKPWAARPRPDSHPTATGSRTRPSSAGRPSRRPAPRSRSTTGRDSSGSCPAQHPERRARSAGPGAARVGSTSRTGRTRRGSPSRTPPGTAGRAWSGSGSTGRSAGCAGHRRRSTRRTSTRWPRPPRPRSG